MKPKPIKPNPETPNRKILLLAHGIIQAWAAQGKEFSVDDVAHELYRNVLLRAKEDYNGTLECMAVLAREGCYQFAWDEWQNWRES